LRQTGFPLPIDETDHEMLTKMSNNVKGLFSGSNAAANNSELKSAQIGSHTPVEGII
jgi:hypothetical protein